MFLCDVIEVIKTIGLMILYDTGISYIASFPSFLLFISPLPAACVRGEGQGQRREWLVVYFCERLGQKKVNNFLK